MVGKYPAMKTKSAGKSYTTPPHDSTESPPEVGGVWKKNKSGQYLMNTGSIVLIVGTIYTTVDWFLHRGNPHLQWNQMLGPFQVIVGLVLLFVGFFWHMNIMADGNIAKSMPNVFQVSPVMPISSPIPMKLSDKTQEACQASESQPDSSVNDPDAALPPYDAVCYADNAAFVQPGYGRSSPQKTGDEKGTNDETRSTCSNPPAYKDINPSSGKCSTV